MTDTPTTGWTRGLDGTYAKVVCGLLCEVHLCAGGVFGWEWRVKRRRVACGHAHTFRGAKYAAVKAATETDHD